MNASQGHYATRRTPEYTAWSNMRQRAKQRDIPVCDRWLEFENFLADMGEKPEGLSLSRIDDNGSFEPGNCYWTTRSGRAKKTHGHQRDGKKSPTYRSWDNMIQRTSPKSPTSDYYAGRGITVCAGWRRSFEAFLEDMGERPEGKTLDRWPDNDGGYWCGHCDECARLGRSANCRWATWSEQMKNRRPSAASLANLQLAPWRVKAAADEAVDR